MYIVHVYAYIFIFIINTVKPLYKNLCIRKLFTHLVGIQHFPNLKTLYKNIILVFFWNFISL